MQSRMSRWRARQQQRLVRHATDAVSTGTLQQELQAHMTAQINR